MWCLSCSFFCSDFIMFNIHNGLYHLLIPPLLCHFWLQLFMVLALKKSFPHFTQYKIRIFRYYKREQRPFASSNKGYLKFYSKTFLLRLKKKEIRLICKTKNHCTTTTSTHPFQRTSMNFPLCKIFFSLYREAIRQKLTRQMLKLCPFKKWVHK